MNRFALIFFAVILYLYCSDSRRVSLLLACIARIMMFGSLSLTTGRRSRKEKS